jgi:DNA integrity scanning protein DisA with diadenylate cyclase activity
MENIIIIKGLLIYILLGGLIYLIGLSQADKELTHFKQTLFLTLGIIFKPVIVLILIVDGYILPTIRQKRTIRYIRNTYNKVLKNADLTDEERLNIIHKRDTMITFLSNVGKSEIREDE